MAFSQLLLFALLLKGVLACVQNAPSYNSEGWDDDNPIPNWILTVEDGNTDMILLLTDYTFNCTGRVDTLFLWWIVGDSEPECTIDFTIYVLRPPSYVNSGCSSTQVVGSHTEAKHFTSQLVSFHRPEPDILTSQDDIYVQPGDFLALEINIGNRCGLHAAAWMRGRWEPSTVLYRRSSQKIAISDFFCDSEPYTFLNHGRGFISAHVEPLLPSTSIDLTDGMSSRMRATSLKSAAVEKTAVTHLDMTSIMKPVVHSSPTSIMLVMPTSVNSLHKQQSTITSRTIFEVTQEYGKMMTRASSSSSVVKATPEGGKSSPVVKATPEGGKSSPVVKATPEGGNSFGTSLGLGNLLFFCVVGSLVASSVMLIACVVIVIVYTCKRKNTTRHSTMERKSTNESAAPPSRDSVEADEYYDYPVLQANLVLQNNAAYNNPKPTVFTTYL